MEKPSRQPAAIAANGARGKRFIVGIGFPYCAILATDQANRERQGPGLLQFLRLVRNCTVPR
jgi:hypothetical protein